MANFVYNHAKYLMATGALNLLTDNLAVLLVTPDYAGANASPDSNMLNDGAAANVASFEITTATVSGYHRYNLANRAVTENDTDDNSYLSADPLTFELLGSGNTVSGAVLIKDTGANTTSPLIAFFDFTDTPTNGGDITVQWASNSNGGILRLT